MQVWKTWSYGAITAGVSTLYGVGGHPPERGVVRWGTRYTTVDYPPVALYELAVAGALYRAISPGFADTKWLNAAMKLPALAAELALAFALWWVIGRRYGEDAGQFSTATFWGNPSMWLAGSVLGYLDPLMALPAVAAILSATAGRPALAGALLAVAVLTKAQAVFIAPVVALAIWNVPGRPFHTREPTTHEQRKTQSRTARVTSAAASAGAVTAAALCPYIVVGAWRNLVQGIGSLFRHDMLSADAANLWWIITYVLRAVYAVADLGLWGAWSMTVRILGINRTVELGYPNPRMLAGAAVCAAAGWALWRARRTTDGAVMLACAAFIVHAYFVLGVQVHENHLYLAVPLLAAAAAARPRLRPVLYATSAMFALNLYLFFGFGRGFPLPPRNVTIVDATVLLAAANCAALVWHARRYSAVCRCP